MKKHLQYYNYTYLLYCMHDCSPAYEYLQLSWTTIYVYLKQPDF